MITKKLKQMITGESRILEIMDEDEDRSMVEWFEAFRFKLPTLTFEEFKECWSHASLRMNSQYSCDTIHRQRVVETCPDQTPPFFFLALLACDDPSEFIEYFSVSY